MLLAGDIGGTKTVLAVYSEEEGPHKSLIEKVYPSAKYPGLEQIIQEFFQETGVTVESGCFGVAGPIMDGVATITNLPWSIDETKLKDMFHWKSAKLLNDLEAVAYAVTILKADHIHTLNQGTAIAGGNIAVLAPGTGLGEGFLTYDGAHYRAHASEGAHASFGPINALQGDLLAYMRAKKGFDHVSVERVCSGALGIPNLYDFLKDSGRYDEPDWLARKLAASDDPTPVIFGTAEDRNSPCELCIATLDLFVSILGAEAGNLALKVLSTGGLFLGGGIPPRIIPHLEQPAFLAAMCNKGRFKQMLKKMPVHVILNAKAGLVGAAAYGLGISESKA